MTLPPPSLEPRPLLPCPFCAWQPTVANLAYQFIEHRLDINCPLGGRAYPLEMWNRRPSSSGGREVKCPFCHKYTRVYSVPFHEECMRRVEVEGDEEERQKVGRLKREITVNLIASICESKIARFRCEGPIRK